MWLNLCTHMKILSLRFIQTPRTIVLIQLEQLEKERCYLNPFIISTFGIGRREFCLKVTKWWYDYYKWWYNYYKWWYDYYKWWYDYFIILKYFLFILSVQIKNENIFHFAIIIFLIITSMWDQYSQYFFRFNCITFVAFNNFASFYFSYSKV